MEVYTFLLVHKPPVLWELWILKNSCQFLLLKFEQLDKIFFHQFQISFQPFFHPVGTHDPPPWLNDRLTGGLPFCFPL